MDSNDINAQSIRDSFGRFEEKSIHLKDLIDRRRNRAECATTCITCICFPCIFCAACMEFIFSPKKKEDVLLDKD
jgi:hypothetical protein